MAQSEKDKAGGQHKGSAPSKAHIVLEGLADPSKIQDLCKREGISRQEYENWLSVVFEAEKRRMDVKVSSDMSFDDTPVRPPSPDTSEWLSDVVQSLDQCIALYDCDLNFLYSNDRFVEDFFNRVSAVPPQQGEHLSTGVRRLAQCGLFKVNTGSNVEDVVNLVVRASQDYQKNLPLKLFDGRLIEVTTHRSKADGYLVSIQDATDQTRTDQRARDMFTDALESLREGVALWDDDEKLVFYNDKYLGFVDPDATAHHVGQSMTDVFGLMADQGIFLKPDGVELEEFKRSLVELVRTGAQDVEVPFAHGILKGSASKTPLGGRLVTLEDITERTRMSEELERQREIAQQNEKISAMGGMLAGVAHELNNPLSIVVGYALMLQEKISDPEQKRQIERIGIAAERCARIVKAFLAMARQRPMHVQPCSLNVILETALDISGHGLKSTGAQVVLELDSNLPLTCADSDQIVQVLSNLISNAEHALEALRDDARLRIRTYHDDGTDQVCVEVWDNGPGIGPDDMERIFEPFFTTKEVGMGTGIGLAFCQRVVTAHGGELTARSTPGEGTCFAVRLPVSNAITVQKSVRHHHENASRAARVLVVDDETDVRNLLRDILENQGYQVETFNLASNALERLKQTDFDVILSDIKMPGIDGEEFLNRIRQVSPQHLGRLAFITGDTLSTQVANFLKLTTAKYLEKPLAPSEIIDLVEQLQSMNGGNSNE